MMGKSSHGKKTDQETQSPMLRIFKEIMQREKHDPEKSSQSKDKRKTKKKRFFSSQSKSELKSPESSYVDSNQLKQQYIVQEAAKDYHHVHQARTSFGGSDKAGNSKQSDDTCSISCALKRLLSNEYACVGCLLFIFTITVITAFVLVFQAMPLVPETNEERFLRNIGTKPIKSDHFKYKMDALSKSIKDQKRSVWDNTLSNHMDTFSSSDARDLSFGSLASLSDPEFGPSMELAEVLESNQLKSGDSSERLRNFYTNLLKTDEQIKHLKKGVQAVTPDFLKMFTLNPYYRLKRQAQFRNIFAKKRHKEITVKDVTEKNKKDGKANNEHKSNKKLNINEKNRSHNNNKNKRAKTNRTDNVKDFKNKDRVRNVEIIRHKRFDNDSKQIPAGILIEKKKILLEYLPNETSKIAKCSHAPKDSNSHENQRKHPFYKNTQRLDELLDKYFDKNIKDMVIDPFGLSSMLEKNKCYNKVTTAPLNAYHYAQDVTSKMYNQYVQPTVDKAKQLKSDIMKMIQEEKGKVTSMKLVAKENNKNVGNNKHNARMMDRNEVNAVRKERNEDTTLPIFDVMLSISTVINSPDARIFSDNSDETLPFSGRKLLQSDEEVEEIQYEDLKEVLSDDKDSHDEIEKEVDRRKRDGIETDPNTEDPFLPQAPTKYTNPPGVQNPNWKGPMPLYPDELSAMIKVESPDVKNNLPGVPANEDVINLDTLEAELDELSFLQEYPEPKQFKMAQAYSDYGVFNEKKDAIKNEKSIEKIVETEKIDESRLKLEGGHPKKSIQTKRNIFRPKKKVPGFTRSKDEKEGFSVHYEQSTKLDTVQSTEIVAQVDDIAAAQQLQLDDVAEKLVKTGIKEEDEGFMFSVGCVEKQTTETTEPTIYQSYQSCWDNVLADETHESCKCGHMQELYNQPKCCCHKEKDRETTKTINENKMETTLKDLIYCCDLEEEGLKVEFKSRNKYPNERLVITKDDPEESCFCWKPDDVRTPQLQLLELLNTGNSTLEHNDIAMDLMNYKYVNANNNDTSLDIDNYKYVSTNDMNFDSMNYNVHDNDTKKYVKVDDDDKKIKVNVLNTMAVAPATTSTTHKTTTETPLHIGSSEKEGLKLEFRPSLKKPSESDIRNSVAHSLSKYIRLSPGKYTHNALSHHTTMVPADYELLYTKSKGSNKVKTKKNEKSGWQIDQSGDDEFSMSDNINMRSLKSVVFDIDNESYDKDELSNIEEPAVVIDENKNCHILSAKDKQSNVRVKRNAQPFDSEAEISNGKVELYIKTTNNTEELNVTNVNTSNVLNNFTLTTEVKEFTTLKNVLYESNTENILSNENNKENIKENNESKRLKPVLSENSKDHPNNLNVLPMVNNTGLDSADLFMVLANWFGNIAGYGLDVTPVGNNHSLTSPNVISFVKKSSTLKPPVNISEGIIYPMYDADMVDNIGHRSRVLLSIEEDNHNKSMLATEQVEKENTMVKGEKTTMVLATANNKELSTKIEVNQTLKQNEGLESNRTLVKRSVPKQNSLIFWNEIYDDEYGVQDPLDKSEEKSNKHSAISSGNRRNVIDKSAKWFGDKMKRIRNSIKNKSNDKKEKVKARLYRDVNSYGVYTDPTLQYGDSLKKDDKPADEEIDSRESSIDFAALTANMKEVCRQAAKAVQQTRNLVVRQDDAEATATAGLMQQLVKLMSDLVDYQVKQKTCLRLPSDLKDFLEWLTLPTTVAEHRKNLKVIPPDHDTDSSQALDFMTTQVTTSEREERPDSRSECLGTIHAVKELMQQYTDLSEEDKSKMSGVKEYLQGQLEFLSKRLESLSDIDLSKTKEAPFRYKRYVPHENHQKSRIKKSLREQSNSKYRFLKHGKKHTRTTPNVFDGSTDSLKKDSLIIDAKFIENKMADQYAGHDDAKFDENKMTDQYGGQINEEGNNRDVKRNLKDVYYKALADAKKFTTAKSLVHKKDAGSEDFAME